MSRTSLHHILKAIDIQAIALGGFRGSHLKRSVAKQAQSKSIELPGSNAVFPSHAREVGALIEKTAAA